jgi:uncharacterized membrane protein
VIMLMIALAFFVLNPAPNSSLMATLQLVLGGMSLKEAYIASILARLTDPWLLLVLTALLAMVVASVAAILKVRASTEEAAEENLAVLPVVNADLFALLLIFTGLALTLIVEFVYLRDSFGVRMNTVFKFYYQAWVMLGLAGGYGTWWVLDHLKKPAGRLLFTAGAVFFIALGLVYPLMAYPSRAGGFMGPTNLDGSSSIAQANPDDWAAIQWLDANAAQGLPAGSEPVILEAPSAPPWGGSYTYEGRISAFTGFPTVLGWAIHESQWRGSYDEQARREPDIATIYTSSDGQVTLDLLHKWGVDYVILGGPEMSYIQHVCSQSGSGCSPSIALRKFSQVLEPVFTQGQMTIYKVP